jgi:methyl-accepting chemotaxis protein
MAAVERMKGLTGQVRTSTSEQSKVGKFIAQSTERITEMIQQIKRACEEQTRGSAQIVEAVKDIQLSTNTNLDATEVMNEAVSRLSSQTGLLKKEIGAFKVELA